MLERGDQVRHFAVTTLHGMRADYSEIWQRRNLLLVCLPVEAPAEVIRGYASQLSARIHELSRQHTACVITSDCVSGVPRPGVVIADRWGEIYFVAGSPSVDGLPSADALLEWLRYIQNECPECQGEVR
jgi:hypothetical protein